MSIARLFRTNRHKPAAHRAYVALVTQARAPGFYLRYGIPDTLDGRWELITLHAFLVLHRLRGDPAAQEFSQALFDVWFADMDRGLRELGTGDLSVGKQVKHMAQSFYGRAAAYQAGLDGSGDLPDALRRNLLGTVAAPDPAALGFFDGYLRAQATALAGQDLAALVAGEIQFLPLTV